MCKYRREKKKSPALRSPVHNVRDWQQLIPSVQASLAPPASHPIMTSTALGLHVKTITPKSVYPTRPIFLWEGLWVLKWKAQNGFPYLIVDFVWGFWLPRAGWRWSAFAGSQSCGCCWEWRLRRSCAASCPAATWARLRRPASSWHGCWHWLSGRPGLCAPGALRNWHPSPCIHISLHPFSSLWRSEACERCHCLGLSLSEKWQVKINK